MSQTKQHQCCATVESMLYREAVKKAAGDKSPYTERDFRRCTNKAKVRRGNKWYCGVHDPVAVRARHKKQDEAKRERYRAKCAPITFRDKQDDLRKLSELYRKEIDLQQRMVSALATKVAQLTRGWAKVKDNDFDAGYWTAWAKHDAESAVAAGEG